MGERFETFQVLCLRASDYQPESLLCPGNCRPACFCRIVRHPDGSIVGICDQHICPDRPLTLAEITPLELDWDRLARALCKAFGCQPKIAPLGPTHTIQICSWSADAVPVILTIQTERHHLRATIAELGARLRRPFILLSPTTNLVDAGAHELLANFHAAIFGLDVTVRLTDHGTLHCTKSPGELFAQFTPQPKDSVGEDVARQTIALAKALDSEQRFRKAPVYTVFLLYCAEGLTVNQIAKECGCSRSLVFARLKLLRQKLGRDPAELRQYSSHFQSIEDSLSDPRARRIYRKGAIHGDEDSPDHLTPDT